MTLFDAYIVVDWSSRNKPSPKRPTKDAIWMAIELKGQPPRSSYHRTRHACIRELEKALVTLTEDKKRVLLGFDFTYAYPAGLARALDLKPPTWLSIWKEWKRLVRDDELNGNNRFEVAASLNARLGPEPGPFWGCPAKMQSQHLFSQKRTPYPFSVNQQSLQEFRIAEQRLPGTHSAWKTCYAGSVGGQSSMGIPYLHDLRFASPFAEISKVWPFETGFSENPSPAQGPFILHAEIWPGAVPGTLDPNLIRDQAQVEATVSWLSTLDDCQQLGARFAQPGDLTQQQLQLILEEEGWIIF